MVKLIKKDTAQLLGEALGTILICRGLALEGARKQKELPAQIEGMSDIMASLMKDFEVGFYYFSAGMLMLKTFGKEGKLRTLADKALCSMVKQDLANEDSNLQNKQQ